jgi:hypothetical protein
MSRQGLMQELKAGALLQPQCLQDGPNTFDEAAARLTVTAVKAY